MKKRLLKRFPQLYQVRVSQLQLTRSIIDRWPRTRFARHRSVQTLPCTCKRHQSLLRRKLGTSDPILQENKITNLRIAMRQMDGIIIRPGETFSFWQAVGKPTAKKGYIEGLLLSHGEVMTGVGGGICQLANMLFWLALHTPLTIAERHHHSFDPFPDDGRVLPFGSGASVFFNYIDLRFFNNTNRSFQFRIGLTDKHLKGSVHCDEEWPYTYHVQEKNHCFLKQAGINYRQNEIWQTKIDRRTGSIIGEQLLIKNFSEVRYELPNP
ncbi:MAG: VanW family protein [Gorillibacterium sp.]|nr:VanW family protein [Gorillibacterium sp.]